MNLPFRAFCRIYQFCYHLALPILPYREPKRLKSILNIAEILKDKNINSVMLITDNFLVSSDVCIELQESISRAGINLTVYDKTCPNPTVANVHEAKELYVKNNCEAIIAYGGGSPMDCAKAVGSLAVYPKKSINQLGGQLKVLRRLPTLFAVPTTAGTGSEVTLAAIITDSESKHKYAIMSFPLIPHYAVLDPKVTFTLPKHLTATTGMDALTHAVEAYIGRSTSMETRKLSIEAVKLIFNNIETAYNEPTNEKARTNMLKASYKAGIAFSKSYVGYVHAVAHSLGGQYNVPHGLANAVLLPVVLKEYGKTAYKKLHILGIAAGVATNADSHQLGAEKFISAIEKLNAKMGIPKTIPEIKKEDIPQMAKYAAKEANPLYPVPKLMNKNELTVFYERAADWSK